jgi:hypothetical protein
MTTISPTAFGGTTVRPARRSRATSTSPSISPSALPSVLTDLRPAPQRGASPVVETADANTAELLLASVDLAGRRRAGHRSPLLATAVVLGGVLLSVLLAVAAAGALAPLLGAF